MDASVDHDAAIRLNNPGRFTRVFVETRAGEIEARLSEYGNWDLRVRRHEDDAWRLACTGDLDCGAVISHPVISPTEETVVRGPLAIDLAARRVTVGGEEVVLAKKEYALLLALASQPDRVFAKPELLQAVWGYNGGEKTRTLDSHASRLCDANSALPERGRWLSTPGASATGSGTGSTPTRSRPWRQRRRRPEDPADPVAGPGFSHATRAGPGTPAPASGGGAS